MLKAWFRVPKILAFQWTTYYSDKYGYGISRSRSLAFKFSGTNKIEDIENSFS